MRVLAACSLGGAGHFQPLVPFLDAARRAGLETLVVGPPALRDIVAASGHPFSPGDGPPESLVAPIRERLPIVSAQEASVLANRDLFAALATGAMLPAVGALVSGWQPDVVLRDPCEYASAIVAHDSRTPVAQVAIGLAEVEWSSIDIAAPELDARCPGLSATLRRSPYVTRFPASLDPSPFPDTRRFNTMPARAPEPLPDWWNGSRLPLVYVSFGTVLGHMTIAAEVYRTALRAVEGLDARVLLTVGRRFDPASLGALPANVHVEPWVDQHRVLPKADVVFCHGGSGTSFGALQAGLPLVIVPLFADQHANGATIAESGSGVLVDLPRDDARAITDAIGTVLSDPTYRDHAQRIRDEMAAAPSVDTVLAELLGS